MAGSYKFSLLTGKWTVVYNEVHRNSRFRNLLERDCLRVFRIADRIADMNVSDS